VLLSVSGGFADPWERDFECSDLLTGEGAGEMGGGVLKALECPFSPSCCSLLCAGAPLDKPEEEEEEDEEMCSLDLLFFFLVGLLPISMDHRVTSKGGNDCQQEGPQGLEEETR